jgi:hypothetical protein
MDSTGVKGKVIDNNAPVSFNRRPGSQSPERACVQTIASRKKLPLSIRPVAYRQSGLTRATQLSYTHFFIPQSPIRALVCLNRRKSLERSPQIFMPQAWQGQYVNINYTGKEVWSGYQLSNQDRHIIRAANCEGGDFFPKKMGSGT